MIEYKAGNTFIKFYEGPEEMPMDLYFIYGQYVLIDYESGGDIGAVDRKFRNMDTFIANKMWDNLVLERHNLHQTFFNIINKIHFPSLQFGCFIHSINGQKITDYSVQNLMDIQAKIGSEGFTYKNLRDLLEDLKKKFKRDLMVMFPEKFGESGKFNMLSQVLSKSKAELEFILSGELSLLNEIRTINEYFLSTIKPKNINLNDQRNVITQARKSYEQICLALSQINIHNAGQLSVVKFYIAIEAYEKKKPKRK